MANKHNTLVIVVVVMQWTEPIVLPIVFNTRDFNQDLRFTDNVSPLMNDQPKAPYRKHEQIDRKDRKFINPNAYNATPTLETTLYIYHTLATSAVKLATHIIRLQLNNYYYTL